MSSPGTGLPLGPGSDGHVGRAPYAWSQQSQWRILEVGFASGGGFLRCWRAWKDDPKRPALLHYVAIDAAPGSPQQVLEAGSEPHLKPLAQLLAAQCFGLLPGFHRLSFETGHVLLTLCVGDARAMLREHDFFADEVVLGEGFSTPDLYLLKAITRLCRPGTRLGAPAGTTPLAGDLRQCGFIAAQASSEATAPAPLSAVHAPHWVPKRAQNTSGCSAGHCVVVGGGLAGAAAAASLARRGWQVVVLDAAPEPAAGASSLPAGLLAPHQSPDDSLLSRLCRSGVRVSLQQASELLVEGQDWQRSGLLAHRADAGTALPANCPEALGDWSRPASPAQKQLAGLGDRSPALWHEQAAWIKPAALVRAWLAQPGITWRGGVRLEKIAPTTAGWHLLDGAGEVLAQAGLVVIAAAQASGRLLPCDLVLQPVRGQVSWATEPLAASFPPFPVNGQGHFLSGIPLADGPAWLCGATFDRDDSELSARARDHASNLSRLEALLPSVAAQLAPAFYAGEAQAWVGLRCASADRRPLVGELAPGLWISTAMGSRGLTFAALCAELIAARLHAEPLPLPRRLARALDVQRQILHGPHDGPYSG